MIKSDADIYRELERVLKKTGDTPLTCVDIFDQNSNIRDIVGDGGTNRVSDYLGHMWRRGIVQRWFAAQTSTARARYAYTWKEADEGTITPRRLAAAKATYMHAVPSTSTTTCAPQVKPNVLITEAEGKVVLDFEQFTITVERK